MVNDDVPCCAILYCNKHGHMTVDVTNKSRYDLIQSINCTQILCRLHVKYVLYFEMVIDCDMCYHRIRSLTLVQYVRAVRSNEYHGNIG